ncbi:MAG: TCP-1/cpn60 chaperonin family protein [Thermomicrobiales bacterium]
MALTLGPANGPVMNAREDGSVELLTDAGSIARRIVEMPDRGRNTGAMMLRNLAWRMHEQYGDGAATAAVLANAIVREAVKRIEAGVDPVHLRTGLEHGLGAALAELEGMAEPVKSMKDLSATATSMTGDLELGNVLGEIVDILGPAAAITIEEFSVPFLDREYVEGAYWRAHPAARGMIPEGRTEVMLERPLIMLADQDLDDVDDIQPALEIAARPDCKRPLLIVAPKVGDNVVQMIAVNQTRGVVNAVVAGLNSIGIELTTDLDDVALLTNGNVLAEMRGTSPRQLQPAQLGSARKAMLTRDSLTVVGGNGDPTLIAERAQELRNQLTRTAPVSKERDALQLRLARLNGGTAILKIGAHSRTELVQRRSEAEKAFRALTGMLDEGVVPGGGTAYLQCRDKVRAARETCALAGQEHGVDVLAASLTAPFAQLVRNHGSAHPALALADTESHSAGFGFDVLTGSIVNMREHGIIDSLHVTKGALQSAVSAAVALLTTNVVILPADDKREHRATP